MRSQGDDFIQILRTCVLSRFPVGSAGVRSRFADVRELRKGLPANRDVA
jgi:hypothetical protein